MWDQRIIVNGKLIQNMTDEEIKRHYLSPNARKSFCMMVDKLCEIDKRYVSLMSSLRYREGLNFSEYTVDVYEAVWNLIFGIYDDVLTQRDIEYFELIKETAARESKIKAMDDFMKDLDRLIEENKRTQGKCGQKWILLG